MSSDIKAALLGFIHSGAPPEAVALAAFKHEFRNSELTVWTWLKFPGLNICLSAIVIYCSLLLVLWCLEKSRRRRLSSVFLR